MFSSIKNETYYVCHITPAHLPNAIICTLCGTTELYNASALFRATGLIDNQMLFVEPRSSKQAIAVSSVPDTHRCRRRIKCDLSCEIIALFTTAIF